MKKRNVTGLKEAFLEKFPHYGAIIRHFEDATKEQMTWDAMSKLNLQKFVDYLKKKLSPNTARVYAGRLRAVLNQYNEEVTLTKDYNRILKLKKDTSQQTYLDQNEIRKIMNYVPESKTELMIKNQFLIGCLTGARHSDYVNLTSANISGNYIKYVSVKTHTDTKVPLSNAVKRMIKENEENGFVGRNVSVVYFNRIIKLICKKCGICKMVKLYREGKFQMKEKYKFISSHTARRCFATNLYKNDVDIYTISVLCGHSSVEMTKNYICCPPKMSAKVLSYFRSFD